MKILIACEFSGIIRDAFRAKGHEAWSCDLEGIEPEGKWPNYHLFGDCLSFIEEPPFGPWDMMIAHPPCTYLCRSGWHWVNKPDCATLPLKGEPRRKAAMEAREFFLRLLNAPIPRIAVENPRPICHVNLPSSNQIIQPWQFGHGEVKETHLWLKNLPPLRPTEIVSGRTATIHKMPPGKQRSKYRSITFQGIAGAMAEQWNF